ncbi:hypothetical protein SPBR_00243 [Sporothrix brasiliensis 5110]|uniref:Xylanolytic transcriptional activator regulatory domain-containing protein n=1 Tax=Sporothrix brasiliensis 5110 TaxID=1398154 RepID=A0A0C2IL84_9PEZI|nr:uncharacterized protein SPBR_00243 [Sporothrix brasiliensis 5110]KIH89861.1 hypothetical protein SPBR_00243 [Sporothrix brasiliensis 5110]
MDQTGNAIGCSTKIRQAQSPTQTQTRTASVSASASVLTPAPRVAFSEHAMRHQIPHFSFFSRLALVGRASPGTPSTSRTARKTMSGGRNSNIDSNNNSNSNHPDSDRRLVLPIAPYNQSAEWAAHDAQSRAEDAQYLRAKGAFLPPRDALDDCVATYFRVFHPFFPVVDRPAFLARYRQTARDDEVQDSANGRETGPSLLLLQSIVFTASAFVAQDRLTAMGFASRHEARRALAARAKHLHQFGWEPDDIATIQSLLLLSHDYASMADQRHTWLWAHQAIGLAQGAGLHRAAAAATADGPSAQDARLWKRIWWACLVRDRLISLGTRRPMHINSRDCNVPLPTAADLAEDGDTDEDRATKAVFADFLKLCQCVEGVLLLTTVGEEAASSSPDRLAQEVAVCRATLASWAAHLSPPSRRQPAAVSGKYQNNDNERDTPLAGSISFLYQTLLHLIHNVVLTTILQTGANNGSARGMDRDPLVAPRVPSAEMQALAHESTQLLDGLMQRSLVKYCPTQFLLMREPTIDDDDDEVNNDNRRDTTQDAARGFATCMSALRQLGQTYWHAQFYHDFFQLAATAGRTRARTRVRAQAQPFRTRRGHDAQKRKGMEATESKTATGSKRAKVAVHAVETTVEATVGVDPTPTQATAMTDAISQPHSNSMVPLEQSLDYTGWGRIDPLLRQTLVPLEGNSDTLWPAGNWDTGGLDASSLAVYPGDPLNLWMWNGGDNAWTADQATLFDDWLNDDALFQSLFPSA